VSAPQTQAIQIGKFQVRGAGLWVVRLILIGVIVWIAYLVPPLKNWPMWVTALAWVGFSIYWSVAAKNSAESKTSESAESRRVHLLLLNVGQLLLFVPVPGLRQSFRPDGDAWIAAGLALLGVSIALAVWARRHLGRNWSGRIDIKADHELVRTGPYRKLRHPIYTAVIGMCVGAALVDGQVHALVGVAMVVGAYWRKVRMEETNLRQAFGDRYREYRRATWGAVPGWF
jgi:protein-S-isoprenylcysteine O-methyltransferase Ste14